MGFEQGNWKIARAGYTEAFLAQEILLRAASLRSSKEIELSAMRNIPARLAYAHLKLAQTEQALVALEAGRAQLMRAALERNRRDLERLAEIGEKELLERYRDASQQVEKLRQLITASETRSGENAPVRPVNWQAQIEAAQAEMDAIIAEIRQIPGYETFLLSLTADQIQAQAKTVPLVYLAATSAGGLGIIVTVQEIQVVWLDDLADTALREKIQGPADDPTLGGYLGAYVNWLRTLANPLADQAAKQSATITWQAALDEVTTWLWPVVMEPMMDALNRLKARQAVWIPGGLLALLPLHATWEEDATTVTGRRYALDEMTFRYAPSTRALQEAVEIEARSTTDSLLAIDNPDGTLHFSKDEVVAALAGFDNVLHLPGTQANRETVLKALADHAVLHFSTHGIAGWNTPLQSSLKLADGDLTLGEILDQRLPGARLAVLSACETGIPGTNLPNEVISLPAGLVQAGAAGVAASLWSVADVSTAMLMARFYELWRKNGIEPSEALRQAQIWLRDSTDGEKKKYFQSALPEFAGYKLPAESANTFFTEIVLNDPEARSFEHPFYWAAFTYTGV